MPDQTSEGTTMAETNGRQYDPVPLQTAIQRKQIESYRVEIKPLEVQAGQRDPLSVPPLLVTVKRFDRTMGTMVVRGPYEVEMVALFAMQHYLGSLESFTWPDIFIRRFLEQAVSDQLIVEGPEIYMALAEEGCCPMPPPDWGWGPDKPPF